MRCRKMKKEMLSNDLKVALEIYKHDKIKRDKIYLNKLVKNLKKEMSRTTVHKAIDRLFDLGIVSAKWEKKGNKWVRVFYISGEAEEFLKDLYKHVEDI